jgi:HlyD family secretion protein
MTTAPVDLRELAVDRRGRSKPTASHARRRPWLTRYFIPIAILTGFCGVLGWTLRAELMPGTPVTVLPVIVTRAKVEQSDAPLFPAAGWVEPRPTPVIVTSLVEGVIERVTVIEGQDVKEGQPVAYLIRKDAEIAVRQAEAEVQLKIAELASANAQLESAKTYFNEPIQRQSEVAEAESHLAKIQTELSRIPALQRAAQARTTQAGKEVESRTKSQDGIARITIDRAKSDLLVAEASVDEYREQAKALELERQAFAHRRDVLKRSLELKVEEKRNLAEANAAVKAATAKEQQAQASFDSAKLRLERTVIPAPISGKVLSLVAKPGSRLMGLERAAMLDASTVITMYDPQRLQIRADVRFEDLPRVTVGQSVRIETPAVSGVLIGRVITTTSVADIQKNTLQVKVAVDNPPAMLRPDMLVQVTFLAPPQPKSTETNESPLRIMVPRSVVEAAGEQSTVWIIDPVTEHATRRIVVLGDSAAGELVEALSGLHVGDRLIVGGRDTLRDGARVQIKGEDRTLGRGGNAMGMSSRAEAPGGVPQHHPPMKPARLY